MGTPHQGGNAVSMGKLLANIASVAIETNTDILEHLKKDSEHLEQQLDQYRFIADHFDTKFCYETLKTRKFGFSEMVCPMIISISRTVVLIVMQVVDKSSAIIPGQSKAEPIEMHKSHIGMTKAESATDPEIVTIIRYIQLMCEAAPGKIQRKWEDYDGING